MVAIAVTITYRLPSIACPETLCRPEYITSLVCLTFLSMRLDYCTLLLPRALGVVAAVPVNIIIECAQANLKAG